MAGADVAASGLDVDGFLAEVGDFPEVEIYGSRLTNEILLQMAPDLVWVLLVDADGVLAGSSLMPTGEGPWFIGFTGSAPRARGRGLARAAKQAAHRYAFDAGARAVRTTNEERNERMRALNASMGYVKVSGDLRLIRQGERQVSGRDYFSSTGWARCFRWSERVAGPSSSGSSPALCTCRPQRHAMPSTGHAQVVHRVDERLSPFALTPRFRTP